MSVEFDGPLEYICVAAHVALPEAVAHDGTWRAATAAIILGREHASPQRPDAEDVEEVSADEQSASAQSAVAIDVQVRAGPGQHAGEHVLMIAKLFPERIRQNREARRPPALPVREIGQFDDREFPRLSDGQGAEQDRVDQLIDGDIASYTQGQHADGRQREPRPAGQETTGVLQILQGPPR